MEKCSKNNLRKVCLSEANLLRKESLDLITKEDSGTVKGIVKVNKFRIVSRQVISTSGENKKTVEVEAEFMLLISPLYIFLK